MSTLRTSRTWIETGGRRPWLDRRESVLLLALSVALFGCFFLIGRAASPGAAPREGTVASLPASSPSTSIPDRLGGAPAIVIAAAPPPSAAVLPAATAPLGVARAALALPATSSPGPGSQAVTPSATLPARSTPPPPPSRPAPAVVSVPAVRPVSGAGAPTGATGSPRTSRTTGRSSSGAAKSFDSSG